MGNSERDGGSTSNVIQMPGESAREVLRRAKSHQSGEADTDVVITQDELETERTLSREAHLAMNNLRMMRDYLLSRFLKFGAVEPGPRSIDVIEVTVPPSQRRGSSFHRLKVD